MSTNVTVQTSATSSILVPFTTAANAALAQAALDAGANHLATLGVLDYFSPPNVSGNVTLPSVLFAGGVADTVPASLNFGIMDNKYVSLVNAGSGLAVAIGGVNTTLVGGQNSSNIYINQSTAGQAYLGGGNNVLGNAFSISHLGATVDGGGGLGSSTLILDDGVGGSMNVQAGPGLLVALQSGGADSIVANGGTVVVLASHAASAAGNQTATISATSGTDLWVGAQGAPVFVNPGAGNAFIFQAGTGESSATLFGGTRVINGTTVTAAPFTGQATVLGMNGYLESGSAGGSIMTTGTTAGAATLVAGGAGDIMFINASGDTANLGNGTGVVAASNVGTVAGVGAGDTFIFGSGSGQAFGAQDGHNTFIFNGAGSYTVAGFHDADSGLTGSLYQYHNTSGAAHITIADFLAQGAFPTPFDQFDLGTASVSAINYTNVGGGNFTSSATLSDGTVIDFNNPGAKVVQVGTFLV